MTRLRTDVEPRDGRMREEGLETLRFPRPASASAGRSCDVSGARVVELRLPGTLTLHGVAKPLEFPVQARWDGPSIQVAGSARIRRADFGLEVPNLVGYRIEDTGVVELELTLVRRGAALAAPVSTLRRATAVPARAGPDEERAAPRARRAGAGGRRRRRPAAVHRHHLGRRGAPVHPGRRRPRPAPGRPRRRQRARPDLVTRRPPDRLRPGRALPVQPAAVGPRHQDRRLRPPRPDAREASPSPTGHPTAAGSPSPRSPGGAT